MLLLTPTIVNDGRKLFISPHNVSYMGTDFTEGKFTEEDTKIKGIDFMRFFKEQEAGNLRFLSALRMAATYPYVLPSVTLPSMPAIEIMDAGLFDNFGVTDAVRFLYVFRDWILKYTSGVGLVIIRTSAKEREIIQREARSLLTVCFNSLNNLQEVWANMQDIRNDDLVKFANTWLEDNIVAIEFQYTLEKQGKPFHFQEASLSWHMTKEEKLSILQAIHTKKNQQSLARLQAFLEWRKCPNSLGRMEPCSPYSIAQNHLGAPPTQ